MFENLGLVEVNVRNRRRSHILRVSRVKASDEWDKLAKWVVDNKLYSHNVRWLIQIPRLYDVYKKTGIIGNFEQLLQSEQANFSVC